MSELAENEEAVDDGLGHDHDEQPGTMPSVEDLMAALRQIKVGELLVSTMSTLASIAFDRLERRDLAEAKAAIDAIRTMMPLLDAEAEAGMRRGFEEALTGLQVAYADAVARAE